MQWLDGTAGGRHAEVVKSAQGVQLLPGGEVCQVLTLITQAGQDPGQ
jgi:hypothetical protein